MKKKSITQQVFYTLLVIQLLVGCSNPPGITVSPTSTVVRTTLDLKSKFAGTPTITHVPTRVKITSTPNITGTPLPLQTEYLEDCPIGTSKISNGLDEDLYLYLEGKTLYHFKTLNNNLVPLTQVDLNTTPPLYLSPDGNMIYWVKDGTLILFDVNRTVISATSTIPEGSGRGDGWTNDGKIRLIGLSFTEDSELTRIIYTFLDPTDFHAIKQQWYELANYPHFTVGMNHGFVAISPDGSKVLYSGLIELKEYVFLYDFVHKQVLWKSEEFSLVDNLGYRANTIWTNDGKWAVFSAILKESYRTLFAISADGTVLKELAVLDSAVFEGELRSIQISTDSDYIFFPLWDTLAQLSESSAAVAGKGYLLDLKEGVIRTICLKDQLLLNGVFHGNALIYDVYNSKSKKVEVWVLEPKLWQAKKLFEFFTDGIYYIIGKNFAFR